MKKIILLFSLLLTLFSTVSAQKLQWNKHIKNETGNFINPYYALHQDYGLYDDPNKKHIGKYPGYTSYTDLLYNPIVSHCDDKTIVVASSISNTLSIDSFKSTMPYNDKGFQLIKYTEEGQVLWIKTFSSFNTCEGFDMKTHPDGSIYIVLVAKDFEFENGPLISGRNIILARLNKNGEYVSHCLLNNFNLYFVYYRFNASISDLLLIDKKGNMYFKNQYSIPDTLKKPGLFINLYEGVKVLKFDTNYIFKEILHIKLNTKTNSSCGGYIARNYNNMNNSVLFMNDNGTLMLNYYYTNYTIVNGDTSFTKYREIGKITTYTYCDSIFQTLVGHGYSMVNFDEKGKILKKANISLSKNNDNTDIYSYIDDKGRKITINKPELSKRIPANAKYLSIGNRNYVAMSMQSRAYINGKEYYFDSLSTALFEFDSVFNFVKVKSFGQSNSSVFVDLIQDTKDNPVLTFAHYYNTEIDGIVYKTVNGLGTLMATVDKNSFKTINLTPLNDNVGNVVANAFSNDELKNIYAFGNFNGVMEINKQSIIDSNNVDYFFLKLGLCNVPPKLNKAGTLNLCIGANDTIKAQKFYDRYRWYYNETEQRNNITYKIPVTKAGRYYLVVDSAECRGISDVVNYTQTLKLDVGKDTLICNQDSFLLQTKPDKKSYLWNTGSKLPYIYPKKTGKYSVQIKDKFDCPTADTINVKFVNVSKPKLNTSRIPDICEGESVDIFTTANFEKYHWLQNNLALPKDTFSLVKIKLAGNYIVEVDSAGCSRKSDLLTVNVYPNPEIDLGNDKILCNTKTFELIAPVGYSSYLWSTGETTPKIKVKNSGKYLVSVYSQYGCKGSDEVTVTMDSLIGPLLYLTDGKLYCLTTGLYKWYLNDTEMKGETNNFIFPKESGQYKVVVTNPNTGCQNSGTINYIYRPKDEKLILAVYPNPAKDKLNILFDLGENIKGTVKYKMYQIDGKLLGTGDFEFDSNITSNVSLATDFLAQGMYYLEVSINEFKNVVKFNKL